MAEYADNATVHGISYVFEEGQSVLERLLWTVVMSLAVFAAIWFSAQAYINWKVPELTLKDA